MEELRIRSGGVRFKLAVGCDNVAVVMLHTVGNKLIRCDSHCLICKIKNSKSYEDVLIKLKITHRYFHFVFDIDSSEYKYLNLSKNENEALVSFIDDNYDVVRKKYIVGESRGHENASFSIGEYTREGEKSYFSSLREVLPKNKFTLNSIFDNLEDENLRISCTYYVGGLNGGVETH